MELPPELEEAIHAAPDDREAYLVAGDWLQDHGALQGELVVTDERDRMVALLPPALRGESAFTIEWRWGFVHGVLVTSMQDAAEPRLLAELLASPIARFVQKIVVQQASSRLVDAVLDADLRHVRTLMIFSEATRPLDLSRMRFRDLRRLVIRAPHVTGVLALPSLLELALDRVADVSHAVARMQLPQLAMLHVAHHFDPVEPNRWLDPELLPALRFLTLTRRQLVHLHERTWLDSRIATQLLQLDAFDVTLRQQTTRDFVIDRQPSCPEATVMVMVGKDRGTVRDARSSYIDAPERWRIMRVDNRRVFVSGHDVRVCALRNLDEIAVGTDVFRFLEGAGGLEHMARLGYAVR